VLRLPASGGRLVLPDGDLYHNGLTLENRNNVSVVVGYGDQALSQRTKLICTVPSVPSVTVKGGQRVLLSGFYAGHSSPSDSGVAAIAMANFFLVTVDRVTTWQSNLFANPNNSQIGLLFSSDAQHSGGAKVSNCVLTSHPETGLYVQGASADTDIDETYIFDNVIMDNAGQGVILAEAIGGRTSAGIRCGTMA